MERLCSVVACHKALDLTPLELEVQGLAPLVVNFGEEPAMAVTKYLLAARSQGLVLNAQAANQLMQAVSEA